MKPILGLFTTFLLLSVSVSVSHPLLGYTIKGTITGLPDRTWLYLRTNEPIDSCQVIDGRFRMSGQLAEPAVRVFLHTQRFTNYVSFWLENTTVTVTLEAGSFKKGLITGSATQDENKRLMTLHEPINYRIDSLDKRREAIRDPAARKGLLAQRKLLEQQSTQIDRDWIKAYPASLIATELLNIYVVSWGKAVVQPLYNNLSAAMKATRYGREISDYLALYKGFNVGDPFVDFEQPNPSGRLVKLSQVKGKYTLLDFWASWCGPCLEENSVLKDIYGRYKDRGFAVLGVSLDNNKAGWLSAIKSAQLPWENVTDLRGDKNVVALMYGISGIPDNFLLDEKGIIIARGLRGKALDDKLRQLMP